MQFQVTFCNTPPLVCQIDDTELGQRYYNLVREQWQDDTAAIFRDPQRYTIDHFQQLVAQAQEQLGWDWHRDQYDLATTTRLHKDIEQYLAQGFENIPAEHDEILHELHFALHSIESGSRRNSWLQIEWYNNRGFQITADEYPAKLNLEFGDLRLQNPYVGHHPLYLYQQNDHINIQQTCRFHDFVKPGINLVIEHSRASEFNWDRYLSWFRTYSNINQEQLIKFTGHPVVGHVVNLADLETVLGQPYLEFKQLDF